MEETKKIINWIKLHPKQKTADICYSYVLEGGFQKSNTITGYTYKGAEPSFKEIEYWLKTGKKYDVSTKKWYIRIKYKLERFLDRIVEGMREKRLK